MKAGQLQFVVAVASAWCADQYFEYAHNKYDLNQDGVISLEEQSPEQSEAMDRLINDTGRTATLVLGLPWGVLASISFFGAFAAYRALRARK